MGILIIVCLALTFFVWKKYKTPLPTIQPKQCMFQLDEAWSPLFQTSIIQMISTAYAQHHNPAIALEQMLQKFPEINTAHTQICNADQICFYAQGHQAISVVNDQTVITSNGACTNKDYFNEYLVKDLAKISSSTDIQPSQMVTFLKTIPHAIALDHDIVWDNQYHIQLQPHDVNDMVYITTMDTPLTSQHLDVCKKIHHQIPAQSIRKRKQKIVKEYDVRFKNQIIVRLRG